jgi:hypothetical protein
MKQSKSSSLTSRLVSTVVALAVLGLVLRFLPPVGRNAHANATHAVATAAPTDLRVSDLQINPTITGDALYLDGLVTNDGKAKITKVTAEVDFRDAQGKVIASLEEPLAGISKGGTDVVPSEFAGNPIKPGEMRFFRVEVKQAPPTQIPPTWNHEVPELKITTVTAR